MNVQHRLVVLIAAIVPTLTASGGALSQRIPPHINIGPLQENLAFRQQLQRKVTVSWQGQELAVALDRLASVGQVPLWLDRRIDKQQILNVQWVDLSLEQAFENLAETQPLGIALLNNLVYVGPRQAVQELTTLAQQAHATVSQLPASSRRRWLQPQPTSWPRLSEPRALAIDWLRVARIELNGSERIAHDLWSAQSLPPLPLVDRLVLLLAGFDLTCQISSDGKTCEVVSIERPLKTVDQHSIPPAAPRKNQPRRSRRSESRQRFSLRLENQPLGAVLDQFADQLRLEVVWKGVASSQRAVLRKQLVSCDVQDVELDELLRSILASSSMKHHLEGKKVTLQAKPSGSAE